MTLAPLMDVSVEPPRFSALVLSVLLLILAASVTVFWALVVRWTTHRHKYAIHDWARGNGFRIGHTDRLPESLNRFAGPVIAPTEHITDGKATFVRLFPPGEQPAKPIHVLARTIENVWPPTGLRPVSAGSSLVDRFAVQAYPTLTDNNRFVIFSTDPLPARMLARSSIKALLPGDIGVMLVGQELLIDFSQRPFDMIEFTRLMALVDQLVAHLPAPK